MDAVTADKETAKRGRRRLRRIATLLRCLEAIAAAAALLLSWSSSRLSGDLLRHLAAVLLGPRFLFLLANAIVLLLLADSGHLSLFPSSSNDGGGGALYEELLEIRRGIPDSLPPSRPDEAVCVETRALRRSRSEKASQRRRASPELRRAETDVGRKKGAEETPAGEEDDAEEFRRMIEAFIERQTKFHREESMKAIVSGGADGSCIAFVYSAGSTKPSILK